VLYVHGANNRIVGVADVDSDEVDKLKEYVQDSFRKMNIRPNQHHNTGEAGVAVVVVAVVKGCLLFSYQPSVR
jgi:hypothetical protein